MKLGFVSDSLGGLGFEEMLDHANRLGMAGVEINTGGWSAAPHVDLPGLLSSAQARAEYRRAFDARGLEIIALNASGNPLHPADRSQADCLVDTLRLAGEMGVKTVCTMSGLPAGSPDDTVPNWVVTSHPAETQDILQYQWEEVLFPFWTGIAAIAKENGVEQIALQLHGNQCVYNVPSLMQLREVVGPLVGANLDPSQLFWMGADPLVAVGALDEAIYHVTANDTLINPSMQAMTSLLETGSRLDVSSRSWSPATVGFGHGEQWWRQFCYRLCTVGYEGWVSIAQTDMVLTRLEGLEKSVDLLTTVVPKASAEVQ